MKVSGELIKKAMKIHYKANFLVNALFQGEYVSAFKGSGMDFDSVREYQPGDDIRRIDWNVTARTGKAYIKSFHEERELTIMIMVDVSGSSLFGTHKARKRDIAAELAAVLAFAAVKSNDRVGAIIFSDRIEKYLPPRKGKSHVFQVIRDIINIEPQGRATDISAAVEFLMKTSKKKAVFFLISDFLAEGFEDSIKVAAKRHDFIAFRIIDPREVYLPPVGVLELFDPESGKTVLVDTYSKKFRKKFAETAKGRSERTSGFFRSINVDYLELSSEEEFSKPLVKLFGARHRRMNR